MDNLPARAVTRSHRDFGFEYIIFMSDEKKKMRNFEWRHGTFRLKGSVWKIAIKALKVKEEESVKIWERMPTALTAEVVNGGQIFKTIYHNFLDPGCEE